MIYVLIGRSGSGKSSIEREIATERPEFFRVISDTTRPIREGEVDGVDYHYLPREEFTKGILHGDYIEHTCYNGWYYGINKKHIDLTLGDYICVTNPSGYEQLKKHFGDNVVGIVIHTDDKQRLLNYLHREEKPNCYECCRRFIADADDFAEIEKDPSLHHVENIIGGLNVTIKIILEFIDNVRGDGNVKHKRKTQ